MASIITQAKDIKDRMDWVETCGQNLKLAIRSLKATIAQIPPEDLNDVKMALTLDKRPWQGIASRVQELYAMEAHVLAVVPDPVANNPIGE